GSKTGTRVEIDKLSIGAEVSPERAALRLGIEDGNLILTFADGDGLLRNLGGGGEVRTAFSCALRLDSETGIHLEGGTRFTVRLPVGSRVGSLSIHHLELDFAKGKWPNSLTVSVAAGISFPLGAFTATLDRVGFSLTLALIGKDDADPPAHL